MGVVAEAFGLAAKVVVLRVGVVAKAFGLAAKAPLLKAGPEELVVGRTTLEVNALVFDRLTLEVRGGVPGVAGE